MTQQTPELNGEGFTLSPHVCFPKNSIWRQKETPKSSHQKNTAGSALTIKIVMAKPLKEDSMRVHAIGRRDHLVNV